jgi:hypothetical protein
MAFGLFLLTFTASLCQHQVSIVPCFNLDVEY